MDKITRLAQLSVLRASGFSGIVILMMMMASLGQPSMSFKHGAIGLLFLSITMAVYGRYYHLRGRISETEVWIMLPEDERPDKRFARPIIIAAMREQLFEKSLWWATLALIFLFCSAACLMIGLQ